MLCCYFTVQNGLSMLHLAAQSGEDSTHHDAVMQLVTHPRCKSIEAYQGKPLRAMKCHGKTTQRMLSEEEYENKATQMRKLFSPDQGSLEDLLRDGKGAGLVASTLQEILDKCMSDMTAGSATFANEDDASTFSGTVMSDEDFEAKSSHATPESTISVADMLQTRYSATGGVLIYKS